MRVVRQQRSVILFWRALPFLVVMVLLALKHIPSLPVTLGVALWPLALLGASHWALKSPHHASYGAFFLLGLWEGMFSGAPLGLHALLFLLLKYTANHMAYDPARSGFMALWGLNALLCALALALEWVMMVFYFQQFFPLAPVMAQAGLGVLLYPGLYLVNVSIEKRFHRRWWFLLRG